MITFALIKGCIIKYNIIAVKQNNKEYFRKMNHLGVFQMFGGKLEEFIS